MNCLLETLFLGPHRPDVAGGGGGHGLGARCRGRRGPPGRAGHVRPPVVAPELGQGQTGILGVGVDAHRPGAARRQHGHAIERVIKKDPTLGGWTPVTFRHADAEAAPGTAAISAAASIGAVSRTVKVRPVSHRAPDHKSPSNKTTSTVSSRELPGQCCQQGDSTRPASATGHDVPEPPAPRPQHARRKYNNPGRSPAPCNPPAWNRGRAGGCRTILKSSPACKRPGVRIPPRSATKSRVKRLGLPAYYPDLERTDECPDDVAVP